MACCSACEAIEKQTGNPTTCANGTCGVPPAYAAPARPMYARNPFSGAMTRATSVPYLARNAVPPAHANPTEGATPPDQSQADIAAEESKTQSQEDVNAETNKELLQQQGGFEDVPHGTEVPGGGSSGSGGGGFNYNAAIGAAEALGMGLETYFTQQSHDQALAQMQQANANAAHNAVNGTANYSPNANVQTTSDQTASTSTTVLAVAGTTVGVGLAVGLIWWLVK